MFLLLFSDLPFITLSTSHNFRLRSDKMSDLSDRSESSGEESGEYLDYEADEHSRYHVRDGDHHDEESGDGDEDDYEETEEARDQDHGLDKKILQMCKLCPDHESGKMTRSCHTCAAALSLIRDKNIIKELCSESKGSSSSLSSRYAGHCDTTVPTLTLDPDTIQVAVNIFSKGVWRDSKLFREIVTKYLNLPAEQHELLTADLKVEDALKKYRKQKRFKYIFDYQKDLMENLRNLRVIQRPLFALMERTNKDLTKVRDIGEKAGLKFPDSAPVKKDGDGVHVPRVGHAVPDQLKYSDLENIFSRPNTSSFIQAHGLDINAANALIELMEKYRSEMAEQYVGLFDAVGDHLNATEDYLIFYSDIYTMVDSSLRELIRNKVANLFRTDVKSEIIDGTSARKMKEKKPTGLMGGWFTTFPCLCSLKIKYDFNFRRKTVPVCCQ